MPNNNLCVNCNKKPIYIKKRCLCNTCYQKERRKKKPYLRAPSYIRKANRLNNIRRKYGVGFFKDIKSVRRKPFYDLTWLANKYGFSREYARQIYVLIYQENYKKIKEKKDIKRKEGETTACHNDPRHKVAEYKKGSPCYKGVVAEKEFLKECQKRGFTVNIPCSGGVDLVVNGYNVDVKSAYAARFVSSGALIKYYRFSILPKQRLLCDFFAFYIAPKKLFYIVPNQEKGSFFDKRRNLYVGEEKSNCHNAKNKYHEYKNRFSLLKLKQKPALYEREDRHSVDGHKQPAERVYA